MPYQIISYYQLSTQQHRRFIEFLQQASIETTQPAHENMWHDNWDTKNSTVMFLLEKTTRFRDNGAFNIVFDDDTVIACSGVYRSLFCDDLAIAGTRTWINRDYRHRLISREVLLPYEKQWALEQGYKAVALCFNDYNKNMVEIWRRTRLGETRSPRQSHHMFYGGVESVDFPVTIQYTKQWVIYEKLDLDFDFDWESIRYS